MCDMAPLFACAQATSVTEQTSSQALLDDADADRAAPTVSGSTDALAATASAVPGNNSNICKAPAGVSVHVMFPPWFLPIHPSDRFLSVLALLAPACQGLTLP